MIVRVHACLAIAAAALSAALASTPCAAAPAADPESQPTSLDAAAPADTPVVARPFGIVVTASRQRIPLRESPSATSLVGADALARMPRGVGVEEALATVPGVRIDNQADGSRVHVSIRGQGILTERGLRGIKVLLDGLPLNDPSGIAPDLYDVDWSAVERIEVLRGPAGALYGGGGSAGVLNILTRDGGAGPATASGSVTVGSYGFWKALGELGGSAERANYHLSVSRTMGDGWRDHTAFWANNVYGKLHWTPSPRVNVTQVLGWTDYFDENAEGLNLAQVQENPRQANPDAGRFNELYRTDRSTMGLLLGLDTAPGQTLQLAGWLRLTRYKAVVPSSVQHRGLRSPGFTLQYEAASGRAWLKNHLTLGTDLQWQSIDEYRVENLGAAYEGALLANQDIEQQGAALFALDRLELGPDWALLLCARWDDIRNNLSDLARFDPVDLSGRADFRRGTGRAGLAWAALPQLSLYANWGQGFLPPTTEELANNPDYQGGFNAALEPATSDGFELGARGAWAGGPSWEVTGFRLTTERDFDRYRISSRPLETFYRNSGTSRRYGVETHVAWRPIRPLALETAYTWSDFHYTGPAAIRDNWLPNSPERQLGLDVDLDVTSRLSAGVSADMQSRWLIDSANSASVAGFSLWGAHVTYAWHLGGLGGEAMLAGRNLLDRRWMAFTEPDPDGNSYQPGPGREVYGRIGVHL